MDAEEVLLTLARSTAHTVQIEAWKADLTAFDQLKNDYEDEQKRMRGEAYQVASLYALFQTIILSAVSQANLLSCAHWWSPVSLSIAVCVAAYLTIADKIYSIGELKEEIEEIGSSMADLQAHLDLVDQQGARLDLETVQPMLTYQRDYLAGFGSVRSRNGISSLVFLTTFSALIACFSYKTLCSYCSPCGQP